MARSRSTCGGRRTGSAFWPGFSTGLPFAASLRLRPARSLSTCLPHVAPLDFSAATSFGGCRGSRHHRPVFAGVLVLFTVYQILAHALAGATLGKRLLGLRVVGPDGRRPGLGRSADPGRRWRPSRSSLLGLGVLLALFTRSGRALHDLLARTWVVEAP